MCEQAETTCCEVRHGTPMYDETVVLREKILRKPLDLAFLPAELAKECGHHHLICREHGRLAGCLVLKPISASEMYMRQLAVGSEFQGRGIGRKLVAYAEDFATQGGYSEIVLHARETAAGFYETLGYYKEGERFVEVTLPHFQMRKIL